MTKLKIYFNILYKESLGKIDIKKNKQQILLYGIMVLTFLFMSVKFTPSTSSIDYTALNDTIVLGLLQILSITVIAYVFTYMSVDFSYKLNMFFKTNYLNDIELGSINKILMISGVQLVSIVIILIQAGIPLIQVLRLNLFIKFILMTFIGTNLVFIPIDMIVKYMEKMYYQIGLSLSKIRIIILSTLILLYVTIYYTALNVWFNYLKEYDFYNRFANTNMIYYIIGFLSSCFIIVLYCLYVKNKIIMDSEINYKYNLFISLDKSTKYTKYIKLLVRNKKIFLIGLFIIGAQILNYFTVKDLSIANMFSLLSVVLGINFYSYLTHEKTFLKLNNDRDEYKIYFTLVVIYLTLNFLFILLANGQYIYVLESFVIYLLSIYLGIIFPRENNSLNKFMSNFSLAAIVMLLALVSFNIDNESIKITIYIFGILLISIINLRIIRRSYVKKDIQSII